LLVPFFEILCFLTFCGDFVRFCCQKLSGIVGLKEIGTVVAIQGARVGWVEDGVLALFDEVGCAEKNVSQGTSDICKS
jgi:hypothetical protein